MINTQLINGCNPALASVKDCRGVIIDQIKEGGYDLKGKYIHAVQFTAAGVAARMRSKALRDSDAPVMESYNCKGGEQSVLTTLCAVNEQIARLAQYDDGERDAGSLQALADIGGGIIFNNTLRVIANAINGKYTELVRRYDKYGLMGAY